MVRNAESLIGKFHGIPVYKTNMIEYVNNRYYKDEENMYLIDGELIYKNEIFAKYDGNYVSELDAHLRREFYTVPAIQECIADIVEERKKSWIEWQGRVR